MVGHMIVMLDCSTEEIGGISIDEGGACDRCGRSWTGAPIAEATDDGRIAVLQYMHPDFSKITEAHVRDFASEHACSQCGDPTEELPYWMAERVLRANPRLGLDEEFNAICERCAANFFADETGQEGTDHDADHH